MNLLLTNDIHTSLHNWQNQFLLIIEKCILRVYPSRRRHPWLTNKSISLARKKNTSFKAWKKQKLPFVRTKYKSTRNSLTKILKSARRDFFRNLDTSDQKLFWKTVNQLTHHSSSVPVLTHDTGRASASQEKLMFFQNSSRNVLTIPFLH